MPCSAPPPSASSASGSSSAAAIRCTCAHDADLAHAIENIVDGAYFNSGQSCCGLQRIYVHASVYEAFTRGCIELIRPVPARRSARSRDDARPAGAHRRRRSGARAGARGASRAGARPAIDERAFAAQPARYALSRAAVAARCAAATARSCARRSSDPVAGVMQVASDDEAVRAHERQRVRPHRGGVDARCGAARGARRRRSRPARWFMNRCDYLDPALAWVGVKDSGRGCTLSRRRLRAADAAEIIPLAGDDVSAVLKANWNYPTTVWAGPGRIAELAAACARLRVQRPLLVTDEGLREAPMVRRARELRARRRAVRAACAATRSPPTSRRDSRPTARAVTTG